MTDSAVGKGARTEASLWRTLYLVGAWAAVIAAVLFRRNLGAEATLFSGQTPPVAAGDWLALLQSDRLLGLAFLNVFDIANTLLLGLLLLALGAALWRSSRGWTGLALWLGSLGVAILCASNQAFSMLALSDRYAAATTDVQRAGFVAAGEALLAIGDSGAADLGLLLVTLAALIVAALMLRSGVFGRVTAWLGIVGNGLILGYFVTLIVAPSLTFLPHTLGAIPLVLWELLAARRLFQLARAAPGAATHPG